jgi:hypothetical protein
MKESPWKIRAFLAFQKGKVRFDQSTAMNRGTIPKDQQFSAHVSLEVLEELDDLQAFDAASMKLEVKPPKGQAADDRKAFPVERFLQDRRLPARGPSARPRWPSAQTAFVNKDDGATLLAGLFFNAGHSTRRHLRISFSLRSTARRSGRWQLKPLAPNNRQTCPG